MKVDIYTDGSCIGNPGPGAYGYIVVDLNTERYRHVNGSFDTTNNRMEMTAVMSALTFLSEVYMLSDYDVTIYSDSEYTVKTLTEWAPKWRDKGWRKKGGIKNLEMVQETLALYEKQKERAGSLNLQWVRGHNGTKWNEEVDKMVQAAARSI